MEFTHLNIGGRIYILKLHAYRVHVTHNLCLFCTCSDWRLTSVNIRVMTKYTWCKSFQVFYLWATALKIQKHMLPSIIWLFLDLIWSLLTYQVDLCVKLLPKRLDINSRFCCFYINITSFIKIISVMTFKRFEATIKERIV